MDMILLCRSLLSFSPSNQNSMRRWKKRLEHLTALGRVETHLIMARMSALPGYDWTVMDAAWKGVSTRRHAVSTNCAPGSRVGVNRGHQSRMGPA